MINEVFRATSDFRLLTSDTILPTILKLKPGFNAFKENESVNKPKSQ